MRSFINWDILKRIENSPREFIGQRKVSLLEAFLLCYEGIFLKVENEEYLNEKYKNIPSLDEYVREKYHAENIGTRHFRSIISFTSEDERDFFYNYLEFLKTYEKQFPIEEPVHYVLKETPAFTFRKLLTAIKQRYRMWFFFYDLADFRAFLDGYFCYKSDYNLPLDDFEQKIRSFISTIRCESLNLTGNYVTWDRLYRFDRDWKAWGQIEEKVGEKMIENFWADLEKFIGETIG